MDIPRSFPPSPPVAVASAVPISAANEASGNCFSEALDSLLGRSGSTPTVALDRLVEPAVASRTPTINVAGSSAPSVTFSNFATRSSAMETEAPPAVESTRAAQDADQLASAALSEQASTLEQFDAFLAQRNYSPSADLRQAAADKISAQMTFQTAQPQKTAAEIYAMQNYGTQMPSAEATPPAPPPAGLITGEWSGSQFAMDYNALLATRAQAQAAAIPAVVESRTYSAEQLAALQASTGGLTYQDILEQERQNGTLT